MEWIPTHKTTEYEINPELARAGVNEAIILLAELRKQYPDMRISHQSLIINYINKYKITKK